MDERRYRRNGKMLRTLILIAGAYSLWFDQHHRLTGNSMIDGTISVLLGLFICSRPAGNAIDLLFFERAGWSRIMFQWSSVEIRTCFRLT